MPGVSRGARATGPTPVVSERLFRAARSFEIYNEALRYHGAHVEPIAPTEDSDHALCVAEFG